MIRHLDLITAVAGIIVLVLLVPWIVYKGFHPIYLVTVGVGLISTCSYLLLRPRGIRTIDWEDVTAQGSRLSFWLPLSGAILLCLSAWLSFICRSEQYVKPTMYYVLIACATGLAFYSVLKSKSKAQSYTVVGLACVIGLSHIWTEHLLFPSSLIGLDPWVHQIRTLGQPNFLGIGGSYTLMHLYLRQAVDFFGISYKWASLIFVGSFQTAGIVLLTSVLGKMLWNAKAGCIAGLLVASANWVIFFGEWTIPNAIGAVYSLLTVYLVLKIKGGSTRWLLAPVVLLTLIAYATHFIAVVWVLGTLACLWITPALFKITSLKNKIKETARLSVVPLLGVMLLASLLHFTVMGDALQKTVGEDIFSPSYGMTYAIGRAPVIKDIVVVDNPGEVILPEQAGQPLFEKDGGVIGEMTLDSMGMLLYFGLAILGCLIMLRRTATPAQKSFVVLSLTVLAVGFFPPLFGLSVIEHRWWYFTEALLAIPLGVALVSLASTKHRQVALSILVVAVVFLSTIGLMSNMTNRALSPNLIARYAFTEGEIASLVVALDYNPRTIGTDPMFCPLVIANTDDTVKVVSLTNAILSGDFRNQEADVLLLRDALHKEPFGFGGGTIYKLNYNLVSLAEQQGYYGVWRNGEVTCLVRK